MLMRIEFAGFLNWVLQLTFVTKFYLYSSLHVSSISRSVVLVEKHLQPNKVIIATKLSRLPACGAQCWKEFLDENLKDFSEPFRRCPLLLDLDVHSIAAQFHKVGLQAHALACLMLIPSSTAREQHIQVRTSFTLCTTECHFFRYDEFVDESRNTFTFFLVYLHFSQANLSFSLCFPPSAVLAGYELRHSYPVSAGWTAPKRTHADPGGYSKTLFMSPRTNSLPSVWWCGYQTAHAYYEQEAIRCLHLS